MYSPLVERIHLQAQRPKELDYFHISLNL